MGKSLGYIDKKGWKHIEDGHSPTSKKPDKGKFKSNKTLKRTTRATARTKPIEIGMYGRSIHEKTFKKVVGVNRRGKKTKKVRVIREKNGRVVTSFPI